MHNINREKNDEVRVVVAIQARLGSKRLPGKVLEKIGGMSVIELIHKRLSSCKLLDEIVLAIPDNIENDKLYEEGRRLGMKIYRGSEIDIASRMLGALDIADADGVIRLTADCPFVDPVLVDQMVLFYKKNHKEFDYICNFMPYTFPVGMELELFSRETINKVIELLSDVPQRENISVFVRQNRDLFHAHNISTSPNVSHIRLTLDFPEDLMLLRELWQRLAPHEEIFIMQDILNLLSRDPELLNINSNRVNLSELI